MMNDNIDDIRKHMADQQRIREKMAYEMMVENGKKWLKENGYQKLEEGIMSVRAYARVWNQISKSTIPFSLQTIDTMLLVMSTLPSIIGMDVISRKQYGEYVNMLSAIRNHLLRQRSEVAEKSFPKLSTD